jgi:hypothetical protein
MLHACRARGISHILSLRYLALCSDRPKILHAVNSVNSFHRALQAFHVLHIPLHNFYSAVGKFLRRAAAGISGQRPNSPAISQ